MSLAIFLVAALVTSSGGNQLGSPLANSGLPNSGLGGSGLEARDSGLGGSGFEGSGFGGSGFGGSGLGSSGVAMRLPNIVDGKRKPSSTLRALYASYFALQGADVYSTVAARRSGAREINPVMSDNLGQVMAVKAATGLTTYYAVNRMAKSNKKAAIVTLAILNGVTAVVAAHNLKNASR